MKVVVKGVGPIELHPSDFVAEGGQGKVFARGNVAYKVYHTQAGVLPLALTRYQRKVIEL